VPRNQESSIHFFIRHDITSRLLWLTSIILATQEAEIRRIFVQSQPRQIVCKTYLEKPFTKIGMVAWIKVKVLGSSPNAAKKKKITCYRI
jgi:hypothetical protein